MQTLFELKTKLPFDADIFERMKKTASDLLRNAEKGQYTQAIVLFTSNENEYSSVIENALSPEKADEKKLIEKLISENDTEIRYILCLWQDGGVDIPSYDFRTMLCRLNPINLHSKMFVMTKNGYSVMELGATMK